MTDYKDSINLPSTSFPMRANLAQREPEMLKRWQDSDLYKKIRASAQGRPRFQFVDGPPYANGNIHLGHAVNKVLKDMAVKSRGLDGFDVPFVPGWDCHGLPIELQVEKKHGKVGRKLDAAAFRRACRDYALKQVDNQREDFKRLGVLADWDNPYLTLDPRFEAEQVRAFAKIVERGHLQRGHKPVHWCLDCGSALAEAEVEYRDKHSTAIDVLFAADDASAVLTAFDLGGAESRTSDVFTTGIPIWTTTAWTLPANQAVAVGPELDYALWQCEVDGGLYRLLLAEALAEAALDRYGAMNRQLLGKTKGASLAGLTLSHPFYERQVPVIAADFVTLDAGTGAVHIAPGHGQDDFVAGQAHGLKVDNPVGGDGVYLDSTPLFAGQHITKAGENILAELKSVGRLLAEVKFTHSYPHCWRHRTPLIFRATPQWFVSLDQNGLREQALSAIQNVQWIPDWGQQRIEAMIADRPDWCISRQRTWGVPIPLFLNKQTGALHPDTPVLLEAVAKRMETEGLDAWFEADPATWLGAAGDQYTVVTDTMDVWMDSGVVHHCLAKLHPGVNFPADLYLEGSDQHRGWFQSSLLTAVAMHDAAPYRQVLTHGFTVDDKGHKMSKSLGNTIEPQKIVNKLGADILRLWIASTDYRGEMSLSDEILKRISDSYRRMRNTSRFLLGNLHGFDPADHAVPVEELVDLDRWAVQRAAAMQAQLREAYERYEFHRVYQLLHNFCVVDMGGFYLDIIKDRLYTTPEAGQARRSAQTAMFLIVDAMARWFSPILSFTAEEIWLGLPGEREESVMLSQWANLPEDLTTDIDWQTVISAREIVARHLEALREAGDIGSALDAEVAVQAEPAVHAELEKLGDELRFVFITSEAKVRLIDGPPPKDSSAASLRIEVKSSSHEKCVRCWHRRADVGSERAHPELCGRCVSNLAMPGEMREYA